MNEQENWGGLVETDSEKSYLPPVYGRKETN